MTDNTFRYFTPTGSDTFDAGWYLLDDDGMRQGNVPSAAFAGADTMIIDSNTPTSSPLTAGADNDVYLVTTDAPTEIVEISDDIGMNTIRFDTGVDIGLFAFQNVGFAGNVSRQVAINTSTGTSIKITTPDNFVFEFADTSHALYGLSLTAQQMVDYVAGNPIFEEASYTVNAAENIADDAAILTLSGRDKTTATGDLTYTLKVASDIFEISTAGVISLKDGVSLDYETAPNSYDLVVVISDGTNTTEANVTINVTNIDEGAATFAVTGTPKVGDALTADKATDDADGNGIFTYQWFTTDADGGNKADITGATSQSYTPVAADAGKKIGVRVTYTDGGGNAESVETLASAVVAAADPVAVEQLTLELVSNSIFADGVSINTDDGIPSDATEIIFAEYNGADLSKIVLSISYTNATGDTVILPITPDTFNSNAPEYWGFFDPIRIDPTSSAENGKIGFSTANFLPSFSSTQIGALLPSGVTQTFTLTATDGTDTITKTFTVTLTGIDDPIVKSQSSIGKLDVNGNVVKLPNDEKTFSVNETDLEASANPITKTGTMTINDPDIGDTYTLNVSFTLTQSGSSDAAGLPSDTSATITLAEGETKTLTTILGQIEVTLNGKTIRWTYTYGDDIGQYGANGLLTETVTVEAVDTADDREDSKESVDLTFAFVQEPELVEFFDDTGTAIATVTGAVNTDTVATGDIVASVYVLLQNDPTTVVKAESPSITAGDDYRNFNIVKTPTTVTINGKQYQKIDITWAGLDNDEVPVDGITDGYFDFVISISNTNTSASAKTIAVKLAIQEGAANADPVITSDHSAQIRLAEDTAAGVTIATVTATDTDSDTLTYAITAGDDDGLFAIDASTGAITLAAGKALDFETMPRYTLTVTVSDGNGGTATATVSIILNNVNETPVFDAVSYTATIAENLAAGETIATVSVTDPDAGDTLTYTITGGNDDGLFTIDASGNIALATGKAVDFETAPNSYTLTVTATDADGLNDTAQVVVTVTNINEAAATFTITGTPKVGVALTAEKATDDADGNGSGGFTYQWFVDVSGAKTDINGATSATYTPEAADVGKNIGVRVTYTDAGGNAESVEVVTDDVVLTDVVPNTAPVITSNHNAAVDLAEDTAAGETIAAVTATDTDSDTLTYAITAGDDDGLFAIDASGNIALATGKAVDFETAPNSYTLTVEVSDGNGGTDTVDVTINVVNVNEAPVITAAGTGTVAENADGADTGITLTVADEDSGDSIASWAIVNGAGIDMSSLFEVVTASGGGYKLKLVSGQSLNHEDAASHTLTITATDSGGLTHAVEVTVAVTDVNEAPSIVAAGTGTVVENVAGAETGITFTVADPDDSDSISAWAITDADGNDMSATFEVVPASGSGYMLKLKSGVTLDYATASSYALKITAMDAGTGNLASNVVDVTVAVTTIPVFADATASFNLAEDAAADAVVGTVTATDADGAPALTYSLIAGALTVFRIDSSTGAISVLNADALDYETATSYSLTVQVSDGTNTDTIAVTINLTDVNDNAPVFTEASYAASVAENIAAGATIATVAANDVDTVGTLQYRITAGNADGLFAIDATTGVITLASGKALDYETATSHLIGVEVSDGTNTHTARVVVTVTDINEAAPVFDAASYTATVNENAGADAVVATVSATDADAGAVLTYRIVSGNDGAVGDAFTIDSKTGEISIVDPDDLDIQGGAPEQYTLTVEVSDGTNIATVQVTIDVNAAPIVVISPRAGDGVVAEDTLGAETGISVRFVLDGGATLNIANARVTGRGGDKFELVADSDNPGFYVVKLKADQQLSYGDDLRGLRIEATDSNGNVSNLSTRFDVSVNDVAEFDFASGSEAKVGVALTVEKTADDADGNGTGGFSYQWYVDDAGTKTDIAGATSASFTPTSAQEGKTIGVRITYTDAENRTESVEETFTTAVAAADPVNVAPIFAQSEYTATVAESLAAGVAIATVVATDADAGDTLGYAIVSGDADGLFVIDANGIITLANGKALDYETATRHTLTVEVDDGAGGKATTTVVITVTDANEAPVITATGTGTVDENAAGADTGITLSIADEDAGDSITFAITGTGSDKFEVVAIDASDLSKGYTLKLKSGVSLDFEDAAPYTLTITVTDGGDLTDTVDVTVGVNNQDDGLAIVGIRASRGDLDALEIGDTLAASITTADPDGVANGTTGTWRWFHKHNPDATIGTGDSYTLTEADRGAKIGVEYTYSDVVDAANSTTSKAIAILETELARVVVTPAAPAEDTDITLGDTDNNPLTPDVGSKVDAGDGSDTITGGDGNDEITGGKGDDNIDLGESDTDTDVVIYGIGGQSAKDGGDNISNFNRGVDQFVFSLDSNQAEVSDVDDYDSFLDYITKGTATLDDDEFRVQLQLGEGSDGNAQIEGLLFHFANASFYSGGRLSLPLMKISFADPIGTEGIMDIFTDDAGEPIQVSTALNKYFFITDLDYLDDFMGGADSITYEVV